MKKSSKVIDLFKNEKDGFDENIKYSKLLNDFIKPFEMLFPDKYYVEDYFDFAINVWNFANIKKMIPKEEFNTSLVPLGDLSAKEKKLFYLMLEEKANNFDAFERFIIDYVLREVDDEMVLTVVTSNFENFMAHLGESLDDRTIHDEDDFEPNYINRSAIVLTPLAPFFEWVNSIYEDEEPVEFEEANIYLVDDSKNDLDKWLKKKFDTLFKLELEGWCHNKKAWPQKRSYKMFRQWFAVQTTSMVYDLEYAPVTKEI